MHSRVDAVAVADTAAEGIAAVAAVATIRAGFVPALARSEPSGAATACGPAAVIVMEAAMLGAMDMSAATIPTRAAPSSAAGMRTLLHAGCGDGRRSVTGTSGSAAHTVLTTRTDELSRAGPPRAQTLPTVADRAREQRQQDSADHDRNPDQHHT